MKRSASQLILSADGFMGIINDEEIKRLEGERQFGDKLRPHIKQLLVQMGGFRTKRLREFASRLYDLAALMFYLENTVSMNRRTVPSLRQSKARYHRALIQVRHSLTHLVKAGKIVQMEIDLGLKKNLLDLGSPRSGLLRLEKEIMRLECMMAALIKPDLRTRKEEQSAALFPWKFEHLDLPANEGSNAVQSLVTELLEGELKRFTGNKVSDQGIYRFISGFFGAVGYSVTAGNAKTMLYRSRAREKQSGSLSG